LLYSQSKKWGGNQQLVVKIGIHYGPAIAGVIGHHKPQFSLIGNTINTASRVCSTGQEGCITLSEKAYSEIESSEYHFKKIEIEVFPLKVMQLIDERSRTLAYIST
jgi:class 3 adenylate cyclase